jgi:hypothetical protein
MKRSSLLALCLLSACAAAQDHPRTAIPTGSYSLGKGSIADLAPDVRVSLDTIRDSRCPPNVMCVRKGNLDYSFTLRAYGQTETFMLNSEHPTYTPANLTGVSFVLDAPPPPTAARDADPGPLPNVNLQVVHK